MHMYLRFFIAVRSNPIEGGSAASAHGVSGGVAATGATSSSPATATDSHAGQIYV